jgi:hypothetical protein
MSVSSLSARAAAILSARRLPLWLGALAALLVTPAVGTGLVVDDYVIRATVNRAFGSIGPRPLDAFRFTDGSNVPQLMDLGALPWWSSPGLKLAFFRPLAAASHWIDFHLFPGSPAAMHVVSLAWLGATVVVAAALYRRLLGAGWVSGLAALFFAVDPGHALSAGWLSGRNALMAGLFGLSALYAHDRWRRDGDRRAAFVAPLCCAASLGSGESGLATLALLFAHAVVFDGPSLAARARALVPGGVVAVAWAAFYRARGYGTQHSAMYLDPLSSPAGYLREAVLTGPINLGSRFGGPPASFAVLFAARLYPVLAAAGVGCVILAAVVLAPVLRKEQVARFFAISALLAVVPIAGTIPNDRNLLFIGFAAFGLVALVVKRAAERRSWPLRIYAGWFLVLLVVSFPLCPTNAVTMSIFARVSRDPLSRVLLDDAVRGQTVVFVNPPAQFFVSHLLASRAGTEAPMPAKTRALWPGIYGARVVRTGVDQLAVHVEGGMLPRPGTWPAKDGDAPAIRWEYSGQQLGSFVRSPDEPVPAGSVVSLSGLRVEVTAATPDGGPTDVTFTFDRPLEDPSLRFLAWQGGEYAPFPLPRVGEGVDFPPASMTP